MRSVFYQLCLIHDFWQLQLQLIKIQGNRTTGLVANQLGPVRFAVFLQSYGPDLRTLIASKPRISFVVVVAVVLVISGLVLVVPVVVLGLPAWPSIAQVVVPTLVSPWLPSLPLSFWSQSHPYPHLRPDVVVPVLLLSWWLLGNVVWEVVVSYHSTVSIIKTKRKRLMKGKLRGITSQPFTVIVACLPLCV